MTTRAWTAPPAPTPALVPSYEPPPAEEPEVWPWALLGAGIAAGVVGAVVYRRSRG